jgi:hypothetical protein
MSAIAYQAMVCFLAPRKYLTLKISMEPHAVKGQLVIFRSSGVAKLTVTNVCVRVCERETSPFMAQLIRGFINHTIYFIEFDRSVEFSRFQMMYADSYMTRDEFEQMFDHTLYKETRRKFEAPGAFPEVYDKVNKKARAGH